MRLSTLALAALGAAGALVAVSAPATAESNRVRGVASNLFSAGHSHAILTIGSSFAWGTDTYGELGNGKTSTTPGSTPASLGGTGFLRSAAGSSFSLGIDAQGELWGWGRTDQSQTGTGASGTPITSPKRVGTATNWRLVAAGTTHGLAINGGGQLFAWGQNSDGEIGLGNTTTPIVSPTLVASGSLWLAAAGGNQFTVGIKSDGSAWAWGHNASGQLGINSTTAQHSPTAIASTVPWVSIAAGDSHALGIKADGTLWSWGLNGNGQLGIGSTTNATAPTQITSPAGTWVAVSAGGHDSFAVRSDGTLWAWGDNTSGQLGFSNNYLAANKTPTEVGAGYQYVAQATTSRSR